MINLFKIIFSLFVLTTLNSFGQNQIPEVNTKWGNLELALTRRAEIFIKFSDYLLKTGKLKSADLNESKEVAINLLNEIKSISSIDSVSINQIKIKNDSLTNSLKRVLKELNKNKLIKNKEKTIELTLQLEGIDNRVYLEKIEFNKACKENNKPNLVFGDDEHTNIMDSK